MKKEFKGHANEGGVYQITNIINGKKYVGSAKTFKTRAAGHASSLKNGKHQNKHLQASFDKHGADAFLFEVIEVVPGDRVARTTREQELIDEQLGSWESCFNFKKKTVCKEGPWSKTPTETRKKISESSRKMWQNDIFKNRTSKAISKALQTPESKKCRSENSKEMWRKPSHRQKLAKVMRKHSTKQKLTLAKHRKTATANSRKKRVKHYGKILDPLGRIHDVTNLEEFARKHNLDRCNLQKVFEGRHPSCKGWRKYALELCGLPYIRNLSHQAKDFLIVDPRGNTHKETNIARFAAKHGLNKENLAAVIRGTRKSHKGWTHV